MPARLRDIRRALESMGCAIEAPNGGSHWKATRPGLPCYPIPAHNGVRSEIGDTYIRGLCRALQLDIAAFKQRL